MKQQRRKGLPNYPGSFFTYPMLTGLIMLEAGLIIAQGFYLAQSITMLFNRDPVTEVLPVVGLFFVMFVLRYGMTHIEMYVAERYAMRTVQMLRKEVLDVYFRRSHDVVQKMGTGQLVTLVMEGIDHIKKYIEIIGIRTIKTIVIPASIVIYVYFFDPVSSVILVVTVPIVIIFMILLGLAAQRLADRQYHTYTRLSNHFLDSLRGLETLRYLGQSKQHSKNIKRVSDDYRKAIMKTLRVAFLSSFALDFFTSLSIAFVAVGLGFRLIEGEITLLPALTILILAPEYFSPIKQVGKDYHATLDGQIAIGEVDRLLAHEAVEEVPAVPIEPWKPEARLSFENVSVEIEGKSLLEAVSFETGNGMIGLVGKSGAGKSTLLHLLAGKRVPTTGHINLNGKKLKTLQHETWLTQIAYIPQHPYIFPLTLADNIRFYEPDATDQQVAQLIHKIGLGQLISQLPKGMHEKIGEGGRTVSGGQAQRIALARALLSEKPIILLDEPTAQLDIETEYEIKQLILQLFQDRLVFLATHRLHFAKEMDMIIYLQQGKVAGIGKHEQLVTSNESYQAFINGRKDGFHA